MLFIQAVKLLNCHSLFEMSKALKYTIPSRGISAFYASFYCHYWSTETVIAQSL